MTKARPQFTSLWLRFQQAGSTAAALAALLGGAAAEKIESGGLADLGSLRLSHALRGLGWIIPRSGQHTVADADGVCYFYRTSDMASFLTQHFGAADFLVGENSDRGWSAQRGVLLSRSPLSIDGGFLTLWNGRHGATAVALAGSRSLQFWQLG